MVKVIRRIGKRVIVLLIIWFLLFLLEIKGNTYDYDYAATQADLSQASYIQNTATYT